MYCSYFVICIFVRLFIRGVQIDPSPDLSESYVTGEGLVHNSMSYALTIWAVRCYKKEVASRIACGHPFTTAVLCGETAT